MRVGFDVSPIVAHRTGVGNYCYFLLKHLLEVPDPPKMLGFSAGRAPVTLADLPIQIPHRHIPLPSRLLYEVWNWTGRPRVDRLLGGVDVYHATNYYLPPTASSRRVVTVHDLAFIVVPEHCSPKIVRPFASGIGRFCREANAIMVYSDSTKRDIVDRLQIDPEKIVKAPMAVDEGFVPIPYADAVTKASQFGVEPPYLLFVSTLEPRKNILGLLRIFHRVSSQIPHKLVLIGGMGWNTESAINARITELGLRDRLIFPGFVPHHELPAFYCAADAFLFPTHYEGFGLPLLEALTCGCPVVTSDNSSVPEVTGDAALRANSHDVDAFANNVLRVLHDSSLRADLIAKGKRHATNFSWSRCAEITLGVYKNLAA